MKNKFRLLVLNVCVFISTATFSQVGINTDLPMATLDVNGDLRIGKALETTDKSNYLLMIDENNVVRKVDFKYITSNSGNTAVKQRTYALISKREPQFLEKRGSDYDVIFDGDKKGINIGQLRFNSNFTEIIFPPNKAYKATGMIGVRGATASGAGSSNAGYITSQFLLTGDGSDTIFSSLGYTESSTEGYDDGGVTQPIIIFLTGDNGGTLSLKVRYGGQNSGDSGYYLAGQSQRNSVGTYIFIEEL
ncbi:hypothetical protein [Myroides injenensis]|uniref:hypothetical protein n=1 Tax=Myroides injenensis TaxID=1183151 RepID=UPI00226FCB97|nr:hypothetical protein [Myroides injenensis]